MNTALSPKAAEIVAYARTLLEAGGYNSFSYADIAAYVHISKASIHHHFPSKAKLVQTVAAHYRADAREGLALLERRITDPLQALHAYVGYWTACIEQRPTSFCICAMLAAELPTLPAEVAQEVRGHFTDLTGWLAVTLEKGVASGQFRLQSGPVVEAQAVMASVHGAMLAARGLRDPQVFKALAQLSIDRLIA